MEPIERSQLAQHIESATVVFLDTGEPMNLGIRPNSTCHFFDQFQIGDDTIQLRLDWSDLDDRGNPTLDADFYNTDTRKKRSLRGERSEAHHTSSIAGKGRNYCWKFKDYERPFQILICWLGAASFKGSAGLIASGEVIRSSDKDLNNEP